MRIPACPVAPATNTVEGSLRLGFPKEKPGAEVLLGTGIREIFPKSKRKGLELDEPSFSSVEEEESSLGLPSPKDGNDPDFLAKTLSLGFRRLTLEWGLVLKKDELDVRVGAMAWMDFQGDPHPSIRLFWIVCLYFLALQPLNLVFLSSCENYYLNGRGKAESSQLPGATYSDFIQYRNFQHQAFKYHRKWHSLSTYESIIVSHDLAIFSSINAALC